MLTCFCVHYDKITWYVYPSDVTIGIAAGFAAVIFRSGHVRFTVTF